MFGKIRLTYRRRTVLDCWNISADLLRIGLLLYVGIFAPGSTAEAETIPLPRERPQSAPGERSPAERDVAPSSCQVRLAELAVFKPLEPITGPGECTATDVVAIEALLLPDKHRVVLSPPATLRCAMAQAIAQWITKDVAPTIASLGTSLRSIETLDYEESHLPRGGARNRPFRHSTAVHAMVSLVRRLVSMATLMHSTCAHSHSQMAQSWSSLTPASPSHCARERGTAPAGVFRLY